jgi:predicted MFS family arabinose efflux permease/quinol monooxygenase YgiN
VVLAGLSLAGLLTAPLLLALTFINGVGLAMRWPVFAAIVPDIVSKEHLPQALALNGIAMNLSRVVGPVVAGALISGLGTAWVFALNAVLAAVAMVLVLRWKSTPRTSTLPGERFVGAMRTGLQHVRQSPRMKVILFRIAFFFLQSTALLSLLPLVAGKLHGGGPASFTLLLASLGAGAVVAALYFPRWRARYTRDQFVFWGSIVHAAMSVIVIEVPQFWMALPAMFICGMAWISVANSLTMAAQMALPNWVRARGMSIYQMALMGGAAAGSLLWGQVAGFFGVNTAVMAAAVLGPSVVLLTRRVRVGEGDEEDFTPARVVTTSEPHIAVDPDQGPVMVTVEYHIDPERAAEFADVMQATRQARLRQGALSWALFKDTAVPGRYIEYFVDETWVEHLRRLERFTASDAELRRQRLAFHTGAGEPVVKRYVAETLVEE